MTTGMTTAERWYEVARRCANGDMLSTSTRRVFGAELGAVSGALDALDTLAGITDSVDERENYRVMVAMFLALEAEDAENGASFDGESWYEPQPLYVIQTADVVAEEEPMVEYTHSHIGEFAVPVRQPDRRRTWNQKVADGLRKWAHWMEERF